MLSIACYPPFHVRGLLHSSGVGYIVILCLIWFFSVEYARQVLHQAISPMLLMFYIVILFICYFFCFSPSTYWAISRVLLAISSCLFVRQDYVQLRVVSSLYSCLYLPSTIYRLVPVSFLNPFLRYCLILPRIALNLKMTLSAWLSCIYLFEYRDYRCVPPKLTTLFSAGAGTPDSCMLCKHSANSITSPASFPLLLFLPFFFFAISK